MQLRYPVQLPTFTACCGGRASACYATGCDSILKQLYYITLHQVWLAVRSIVKNLFHSKREAKHKYNNIKKIQIYIPYEQVVRVLTESAW